MRQGGSVRSLRPLPLDEVGREVCVDEREHARVVDVPEQPHREVDGSGEQQGSDAGPSPRQDRIDRDAREVRVEHVEAVLDQGQRVGQGELKPVASA